MLSGTRSLGELCQPAPSKDEDGVCARSHPSADLGQMRLHGLEVHLRHDYRGADAPLGQTAPNSQAQV